MKDYYKILGVKPDASRDDIKRAWHILARKYHPDMNPEDPGAEEKFKELTEAYEILKDEDKRAVFDLTGGTVFFTSIIERPEARNYFYVKADRLHVSVHEEIELTFTYTGEGRVFRRPSLDKFFLTGPPFVSFRKLIHEDLPIRETSLTFVISPVKSGKYEIGRASIRINGKEFKTEPLVINASPNKCYFIDGMDADGPPLKFQMNYEHSSPTEEIKLRGKNPAHTVMIPRSKTAYTFHVIGSTMKWVCMLAGAVYFHNLLDVHVLVGAAAGSFIGGINCHIMYRMVGMKSKFRNASMFPLVREYHERGYEYGTSTGTPVVSSSVIYKFTSLIT